MHGLKRSDTPILKGYQLFRNYIRPHETLYEEMPADRVGIRIEGENRWMTLVQNAKHRHVEESDR
jgi:hypothetical protein